MVVYGRRSSERDQDRVDEAPARVEAPEPKATQAEGAGEAEGDPADDEAAVHCDDPREAHPRRAQEQQQAEAFDVALRVEVGGA
jgi:hypothetical protein